MAHHEFPCKQCGAKMEFDPAASSIKCPYCGHENPIPKSEEDIHELDFHSFFAAAEEKEQSEENLTVRCSACGAETTMDTNVTSGECPFCGAPLVAETTSSTKIRPRSLLPFAIDRSKALQEFKSWVKGLWFAPNKLKAYARTESSHLSGMYVPYWTYDADTTSFYTGQRGEYYYVTESYTTTEDGKPVTKTRQVRKTRWYPASGVVYNNFDDILVLASHSLPKEKADQLEPWDLAELVPYDAGYLSGFRTESYQVSLEEGMSEASQIMDGQIRRDVKRDIGGDEQRIHSVSTQHDNVTFKHILLPIWISAYKYRDKTYRFLVNARTGEVQGERPWSWVKIGLLAVTIAALVGTIVFFANK